MTNDELTKHLEFVDGVQKAQMVALRALLRDRIEIKGMLKSYAEQLESNPSTEDLTSIQLGAMKEHLLGLSK